MGLRIHYIDPGILVVQHKTQFLGLPLHLLLAALPQQEHGQCFREEGQQFNLLPCPHPGFPAIVKADIAPEHAVFPDGTVEHGLDSLGRHNVIDIFRQQFHVGAVKDTLLIIVLHIAGDVCLIADILQVPDLRVNTLVAPFVGIGTEAVILAVFKDIDPADVDLFSDEAQQLIDGFFHILAGIQLPEGIADNVVIGHARLVVGVDGIADRAGTAGLV